jgi:hypothetical protein
MLWQILKKTETKMNSLKFAVTAIAALFCSKLTRTLDQMREFAYRRLNTPC